MLSSEERRKYRKCKKAIDDVADYIYKEAGKVEHGLGITAVVYLTMLTEMINYELDKAKNGGY